MRETQIVDLIRAQAAKTRTPSNLVKGIGDDCAIFRPGRGEDLVFTTDFLLEGRHFERATHGPADIGHKALARSLSDLAAMGAEPAFCLVSLGVPADIGTRRPSSRRSLDRTPSWIDAFYRGLLSLARHYKAALAGGDLARFDRVLVDVMCCGRVPAGTAMQRSTARPGDRIFVTGELGGSALGFATRRAAAWKRHLRPEPRVREGIALRKRGVRSCLDLSDGLSLDLHRLCRESRVSAELTGSLPIARGATLEQALNGGEDYELLFTAPPSVPIPKQIGQLPITSIGTITRGHAGRIRLNGDPLEARGFDHFATGSVAQK